MLKNAELVELICSMSKSEKRNFKLLCHKTGSDSKVYVKLFDHLAKYKVYDEKQILKKIKGAKKSQLANQKQILSKQVLRALRDINKEKYPEIRAREKFDFAKILYAKGQYKASLNMLGQVKKIAQSIELRPLEFLAVNFEKQIEAQHITKGIKPRVSELVESSNKMLDDLLLTNKLSNIFLDLYARYLESGFVKNEEEYLELNQYVNSVMPSIEYSKLNFFQKLYVSQSLVYYSLMAQDWPKYYKYSQRWVQLFEENKNMQVAYTTLYIKGVHNVLNALFIANKRQLFNVHLNKLINFNQDGKLNLSVNELAQVQMIKYTHGINSYFLHNAYIEGVPFVEELNEIISNQVHPWDLSKTMIFNYKMACIYFGSGNLKKSIQYLYRITNQFHPNLKLDIQCYASVLNLIAHVDLGDDLLVSYKIKSVYRLLLKLDEMEKVQLEIFRFIRKTPKMKKGTLIDEYKLLKEKLLILENDRFEKRPFLYLDIISWLDSKILNISMVEAIRNRREHKLEEQNT